ncbi:4-amino-4-deoxy-L-arabinose transferase-like glycosyltransferase [Krasilnikovia cinnamomea]|uniref:4-amino-4-deoxy-L-arabinose transferase-like glycosyltransferase n=1 Tax=Krasilnikovia cinnamomea TaxID=349313 RepID=A0A4Q7ZLJ2_9ACTN|nr:glycosyltransferase family 39 protein [Krasilnikovia cinnamomea]RZU51838.1 4-amino-4-deoxy-L-arabinose transferase-like glycosyltransferase [Krasilnikovia cinnamomea]
MTSTLPVPPMAAPVESAPPPPTDRHRSRWSAFLRGPATDPAWARPALLALLAVTAVLYLWGLGASGWANAFYSAAVQAGSVSWKAFFYGSSDAANSITVDKTPASLWVMALSVRLFGLNAWSLLVPQALMGVATVGLLFATVRRWFGAAAGLIAGAVAALTPVAVLMFRFNNPDALLVLLMVAGAYATVRAIERGATRWLVLAGVLVGFGFLTKMLQALLVVPAYALAYLIAGPPKLGKRIWQLLLAGLAVVVSAGWYIAIVELVPASMRPYIGGSQNNSLLELTLGYNGLGRLSGNETGSVGGGGRPGGGGWGQTGLLRMFDAEQGGQISWLLPAALIVLVAGLVLTARAGRTDRRRAGLILWGGWLLGTGLVFSLMQGIFHAYYTVALAPAVGAVVGMGSVLLWRVRRHWLAALTLSAAIAVTTWWSYVLLGRSADFLPWLRPVVLVGGLAAAVLVLGASLRLGPRAAALSAGLALAAVLAGPAAYAVQTAGQAHTGSIPSAGPAVAGGGFGGPGGDGRRAGRTFPGGTAPGGTAPGGTAPGSTAPGSTAPGSTAPGSTAPGGNASGATGGFPGFPGGPGGFPGGPGGFPGGMPNGTGSTPGATGQQGGNTGGFPGGGMRGGGLLDAATVSAEMKALLEADADSYTWVAAAVGSQSASGYQLATGKPVMPVGGFNGSDPSPTLAQFQQYVREGKIHYFIGGGGFGGLGFAAPPGTAPPGTTTGGTTTGSTTTGSQGGAPAGMPGAGPGGGQNGGSRASFQIAEWVAANFTARTVGNTTVYDLTAPTTTR